MDRLTKEQRSYNMSRVKSKNTKVELTVFKLLKENGIRFKKHYNIEGKPDVAIPERKIAIFINGEFWHGRYFDKWKDKLSPFWLKKISDNKKRDRKVARILKNQGWRLLILWDKDIKKDLDKTLKKIIRFIKKD